MSPRGGAAASGGKPIPGKVYIKGEDGTVEEVATQAYGDPSKGALIQRANPQATGFIRKGTKLVIPGEPPPVKLTGKEPDDLTILVGGVAIPVLSAKIIITMDTAADGWSARIPWTPGQDARVDKVTRPYGYERAAAYIGNELQVAGLLYTVSPEMTDQGLTKELIGYSFTADAIDSSVKPPYERNNVTLKQLAKEFAELDLGVKVVFDADFGGKFDRVCAQEGQSIFHHLAQLAAQRGGLVSNTREGGLLFWKAKTDQKPVGTIQEGKPFVTGWKATYDGRKRFREYRCITAGIKGKAGPSALIARAPATAAVKRKPPTVIEIDEAVPRSRCQIFRADDTTPGNIADAAKWRRNKQFVEALTLPFPVSTWYAPNGKLWNVNTTVTVISPTLGVKQGFTFLIRSVEFDYSTKGRTAMLHLVPPEAYSGKAIGEIWTY